MQTSAETFVNRTTRRSNWLVACAAVALSATVAWPQAVHADAQGTIVLPVIPDNLQVPAGNTVFLEGHAVGTQGYVCLPTATGFAWTFYGPQATLFDDNDEQIITHFLSPNPVESGAPRATWQDSSDTSAGWGKAIATSTDANFVAAGAIPWLLLQVVGAQPGPTNGATLASITYIQRLSTSGGVAPSTGCAQSTDVGSKALVHYTANYFFYKAE